MTRHEFIAAHRYHFFRLHDEAVTEDVLTEDGGWLAFVVLISRYRPPKLYTVKWESSIVQTGTIPHPDYLYRMRL